MPIAAAWPVPSSPAGHPWAILWAGPGADPADRGLTHGRHPRSQWRAWPASASPHPPSPLAARPLAWIVLGAVTIAVWPAFAARRAAPRPLILSVYGSAAVTVVFLAQLSWLLAAAASWAWPSG